MNLATEKATVLSLKAELQKAKKAAKMSREAVKATEEAAYEYGMEEAEKRLAEDVAEVCRDYCTESWVEVLNCAGVPADSKLRKAESVFFPEHIREAPTDLPPTTALSLPPPEQVSDTQVIAVGAEIPIGVVGGRVRRSYPRPKISLSRIPLTSRMWFPKPKQLSQSLALGMPSTRPLISRRALNP